LEKRKHSIRMKNLTKLLDPGTTPPPVETQRTTAAETAARSRGRMTCARLLARTRRSNPTTKRSINWRTRSCALVTASPSITATTAAYFLLLLRGRG
jgi:hypothetical protein